MSERLESGSAADDTAGWVDQCCRLALSRRALRLAALFFAVFILIDLFLTGYLIHAAVEALALAMVLFAALLLRDPGHLGLAQLLGTVAVAMTILVVIISGVARDGVLVWLALFPPIPFFLGGLSRGLRLSAVFAAIVLPVLSVAIIIDGPMGLSWVALLNAGGALLGSAAIAYLYEQSRAEAQQRLSAAANTDPLTGVANRRGFLEGFEVRRRFAQRARQPLSLLLFDLDNLKQINDINGHAAGDAAIRHIASLVV
ncbi:GGDEF domain-containing protein, partial [Halochromatium sp.]